MIISTSQQQTYRIFDFVQTILKIDNPDDLRIISVEPNSDGFWVVYSEYNGKDWDRDEMQLWNSQIILLSTFIK